MATEITRALVEFILLGPEDDRRQLQDSPILGDVWVEFAKTPDKDQELLITPYKEHAAGTVASALSDHVEIEDADIAYLQGTVAARLSFQEVVRYVVPMTYWWSDRKTASEFLAYVNAQSELTDDISRILIEASNWIDPKGDSVRKDLEARLVEAGKGIDAKRGSVRQDLGTRKRNIILAGFILWARDQPADLLAGSSSTTDKTKVILQHADPVKIANALRDVFVSPVFDNPNTFAKKGLVWTVSLNRRASPALTKSMPGGQGRRRAHALYGGLQRDRVGGHRLRHRRHPPRVQRQESGKTQSQEELRLHEDPRHRQPRQPSRRRQARGPDRELLRPELKNPPDEDLAGEHLRRLARGAKEGRSINWELVERLVEIELATQPSTQPRHPRRRHCGASREWEKPEGSGGIRRRGRGRGGREEDERRSATGPTACAPTSASTTSACWRRR